MTRAWAVIGVVAALALPSTAEAAPFTRSLDLAYEIAVKYWGGEPENCAEIDKQIVPEGWLGDTAVGRATIPQEATSCILHIDRRLAPPSQFARACSTMIHEVGHLHGHEHSEPTADIMTPDRVTMPRVCERVAALRQRLYITRWYMRIEKKDCHHRATECRQSMRQYRVTLRRLTLHLRALL